MSKTNELKADNKVLMTASEARGEAAYYLLGIVLSRVSASELAAIAAEARVGMRGGVHAVAEEVNALLGDAAPPLPAR